MSSFVKAAVKIQQGPLLLYATSFTVADLMEENFYRIDIIFKLLLYIYFKICFFRNNCFNNMPNIVLC